jgi:nitrite reductase/ring-hydroxylating ferredoxin subunit
MPGILDAKQGKDFTTMNRLILILVAFAGLAVSLQRCKKSTDTSDFFNPVQFKTQLNLNLPQYINLQSPQGYVYIPEGNKGSVVYRLPQGGFAVYDRTCSFNPDDACAAVTVDSNYAGLRCGHYNKGFQQCCASMFDLNTGTATQKPASKPLKPYYTSYDEVNRILYINTTPF